MIGYYLEIRSVHIVATILSGLLFSIRGLGLMFSLQWPRSVLIRYINYSIDIILLTGALMLMTIIHQYPVVNTWLSVKIALVCIYILLGVFAFRQNLSRHKRAFFYLSALFFRWRAHIIL